MPYTRTLTLDAFLKSVRIRREETIDLRVFALMQTTSRRLLTERRITKRPPASHNNNKDNDVENNENKAPKREKLESEVIERMDSYQQTAERKDNANGVGVGVGGGVGIGGVSLIGSEAESLFLPPIGYENVNLFERRMEPLKDVTAAHTIVYNDDIRSSSNNRSNNNNDNNNNNVKNNINNNNNNCNFNGF